ncbi:hypothetical protein NIES4071_96530 [Calothrix sp. NIES-4071]|nr:hypothetical protein NIES4071_96530 [Calothrix sp. NIES-4071]BAZ63918.1 hypothetical protein NIES4105_96460 [Calothrix sp. NIES-4105]
MFFLLTSSESTEQAYQLLLHEYDVEPQQLKQNLLQFIDKLLDAGLVEVTPV